MAQIRGLATTGHAKRQNCWSKIAEICGVAISHLWPGMANSPQWWVQWRANSRHRLLNRVRPPAPARPVAGHLNRDPKCTPFTGPCQTILSASQAPSPVVLAWRKEHTTDLEGCPSRSVWDALLTGAALLRAALLRFILGRFLGLGEEIDLLGDDLAAVARLTLFVRPAGVVDASRAMIIAPLVTCSATHLPVPLKQVIRCHSVSVWRLPSPSLKLRLVASEMLVIAVPP